MLVVNATVQQKEHKGCVDFWIFASIDRLGFAPRGRQPTNSLRALIPERDSWTDQSVILFCTTNRPIRTGEIEFQEA
jgi:hypothetical protein